MTDNDTINGATSDHRFGLRYKIVKGKGNSRGEVYFNISTSRQKNAMQIKMAEGGDGEVRLSDDGALQAIVRAYKSPLDAINGMTKKLSKSRGVYIIDSELVATVKVGRASCEDGKSRMLEQGIFNLAETFIICKSILKKYRYPLIGSGGSSGTGGEVKEPADQPKKKKRRRRPVRRK